MNGKISMADLLAGVDTHGGKGEWKNGKGKASEQKKGR